MDHDIKPRINSAQHLVDEIARIGALDRQRPSGHTSGTASHNDQMEFENDDQVVHRGALPVSAPNDLAAKLLKVVVVDESAKQDLGQSKPKMSKYMN